MLDGQIARVVALGQETDSSAVGVEVGFWTLGCWRRENLPYLPRSATQNGANLDLLLDAASES